MDDVKSSTPVDAGDSKNPKVKGPTKDDPAPRGRRPFVILGAVAVAAALGITAYFIHMAGRETTDDAQVEADTVPTGARVGGQVLKVHVVENQVVEAGQLLIELDSRDFEAKVAQAEAEVLTAKAQAAAADAQVLIVQATSKGGLASARAMVAGSSSAVSAATAQIESARAGLVRAEADARRAEIEVKRARELRATGAIAQTALDLAETTNAGAQAALEQARAQVTAAAEAEHVARSRVGEARGHLDQSTPVDAQIAAAAAGAALAHARVKSAEAMLDLARLQLSYTKVVAPTAGVASKLGVHDGQLVQPGQPLRELVPRQTYVVANFKETEIGGMQPGQRAAITVDAYPGREFSGKVESLSAGTGSSFSLIPPDNASGNFVKVVQRVPVRIAWTDLPQDVELRAGLSADVVVFVK